MNDEYPPFFETIHKQYLCRVYVTSIDLIFINLGTRVDLHTYQGGLAGAVAAAEKSREVEREVEQEEAMLTKRNADGLRIYARANKRGFVADRESLEEIIIDALHKWKRFFFMTPEPALIIQHAELGRLRYVFRAKKDVIIALYELKRLFGDELTIQLPTEPYQNGLKKYKKMQSK